MRVVYVAGWMRSGTTLLGDLFGAQPGCFNAGEVSGIWRDIARGGRCSCGDLLVECEVWGAAYDEVRDVLGFTSGTVASLANATESHFRTRGMSALRSREGQELRWGHGDAVADVVSATNALLGACMRAVGATTLIDTSKLLPGLQMHRLAQNTVNATLIYRDVRAVAASSLRTRNVRDPFAPPGEGPVRTLAHWYGANLSLVLGARMYDFPLEVISYESLMADPTQTVAWLAERLGVPFQSDTLRDGVYSGSERSHVAVGNPSRSSGASKVIREDVRWKTELTPRLATMIHLAASPGEFVLRRRASK